MSLLEALYARCCTGNERGTLPVFGYLEGNETPLKEYFPSMKAKFPDLFPAALSKEEIEAIEKVNFIHSISPSAKMVNGRMSARAKGVILLEFHHLPAAFKADNLEAEDFVIRQMSEFLKTKCEEKNIIICIVPADNTLVFKTDPGEKDPERINTTEIEYTGAGKLGEVELSRVKYFVSLINPLWVSGYSSENKQLNWLTKTPIKSEQNHCGIYLKKCVPL